MKKLVVLLDVLLRKMFGAKTVLDMDALKLTASLLVGFNLKLNLMFWEDVGGSPVLVVNMPPLPWGSGQMVWVLLIQLLEWNYGWIPKPIVYQTEFKDYKFSGWKPDSHNPMYVYLWNDRGWKELSLNKLILEGEV